MSKSADASVASPSSALHNVKPFSATASDSATRRVPSVRWSVEQGVARGAEQIVVEAPLCLEVAYSRGTTSVVKTLGITMRTPGHDHELALGFLLAEGVVARASDVRSIENSATNQTGEEIETLRIHLHQPPRNDLQRVTRAVTTTSACGLCGRATLQDLPTSMSRDQTGEFSMVVSGDVILQLPSKLRAVQTAFAETGGSHAAALADQHGEILLVREDVGRHNAVDKVFGAVLENQIARSALILVLSGRASFELVQKAASAGIALVVAIGAPSSAAVDLAHAAGITLVGFTRENRFTAYTHVTRIAMAS